MSMGTTLMSWNSTELILERVFAGNRWSPSFALTCSAWMSQELPEPSAEILETRVLAVGNRRWFISKQGFSAGILPLGACGDVLEIVWSSQLEGGLLMASSG